MDFELQNIPHHVLDLLNARITEFNDLSTIQADQVVVLLVPVAPFVLRLVPAELVFADQVTVDQELEGIIHRRPADPVVVVLHMDIQAFRIKMLRALVDLLENRKPFRRPAKLVGFQMCMKNSKGLLQDLVFYLFARYAL